MSSNVMMTTMLLLMMIMTTDDDNLLNCSMDSLATYPYTPACSRPNPVPRNVQLAGRRLNLQPVLYPSHSFRTSNNAAAGLPLPCTRGREQQTPRPNQEPSGGS